MKVIVALALFVVVALAAPAENPDKDAQVLKFVNDNIGVEGYNWGYETSNGIAADESGQVINAGSEQEAIAVKGSFSYTGSDGVKYEVHYTADDTGFHPEGAHIPSA